MITEINVNGFKSLNEFSVTFTRGINVIVGPNGSGKTNICQVLNIISSVPRGNLQNYLSSIGGANTIFTKAPNGSKEIQISASGECNGRGSKNSDYHLKYTYKITLSIEKENFHLNDSLVIRRETNGSFKQIIKATTEDGNIKCTIFDKEGIGDHVTPFFDEMDEKKQKTINFRSDKNDSIWGILPKLFFVCYCIMVDIERLRLINIDPNIAREPCDIIEYDKMHGNGRYLANELSRILQNENYKNELESLLSQAVPSFQNLHISTSQVEFRRTIQIQNDECNFSSANLSDGTIKLIGVLVAIINQDNYTVIIEELENYLHPNVNRLLIDYLRESFVTNACILTSHSETILNLVHPSELIICKYSHGKTQCNRIKDLKAISKAIELSGFGCGYHYVLGNLD